MIEHAKKYIERGWFVFPCNGKVPANAHGFKQAVNSPELVEEVFRNNPNIGIATGKISGIFVLDVDCKKGKRGDETLKDLEEKHGEIPHTIESLTPNNGRHIYFKYPDGRNVGCRTDFRHGLDIRADGGYVVSPPSFADGKHYEWEVSHHPDETMLADAPEWLLKILEERRPEVVDLSETSSKIESNRNNNLMLIGAKLRRIGFTASQIENALQSINSERCIPPLSRKEVSTVATSVARYQIEKTKEPLTDIWNANFFVENFGEDLKFCDELGGWYLWNGKRWREDKMLQVQKFAKKTIVRMRERAAATEDKDLMKHSVRCENKGSIDSMTQLAKSDLAISPDELDKDKYLLNFRNGIFDLESGTFSEHNREFNITKIVHLDYDSTKECPVWMKFLDDVFMGNADLINFMQKAAGYSLSGDVREQCIFILYGVGMNGKSTFLKHIYNILGDYAINTPSQMLMEKHNQGIPNDLARLKGMRFVTAFESSMHRHFSESIVKQLTGDDPISARFLNCEFFDFMATFKIFLATNNKPRISGTDKGIWRRIKAIPFDKVITEKDSMLDEKLKAEYHGIMNWMIEGFRKWKVDGLGTVKIVEEKTAEYREDSDMIGLFLKEFCELNSDYQLSTSECLKKMQEWCKEGALKLIKRPDLNSYMKSKGYEKIRSSMDGKFYWQGIGFKSGDDFDDIKPF